MPGVSIPPNNTWDSVSGLKWIPIGEIDAIQFSFPMLKNIANAVVYLECVEDDHSINTVTTCGQYNVGDRFVCDKLNVVINGSTVKVINPGGGLLTKLPKGNGALDGSTTIPVTFDMDANSYQKYRIRCFASHSIAPLERAPIPFWNAVFTGKTLATGSKLLTVPHGLGVVPQLVEINFICKTANNGYFIGDIIPLKFINGQQPNAGNSIWTTSATDKDILFSCTQTTINVVSLTSNKDLVNVLNPTNWTMTVNVRKDYPNDHGVTFANHELTGEINSDAIPVTPNSGSVIGFDMIILNKFPDDTAYKQWEIIFVNQSGGNNITDFKENSQFQFYDSVDKKIKFRMSPTTTPIWKFCYGNGNEFNIFTQPQKRWDYRFRWDYENKSEPYDSDTGWILSKEFNFSGTTQTLNSSSLGITTGLTTDKIIASKVDFSTRQVMNWTDEAMDVLSIFHFSSLKGASHGFTKGEVEVWNNSSITYNNHQLSIIHYDNNAMTIPSYLGKGPHPKCSGTAFDSSDGYLEFRVTVRN